MKALRPVWRLCIIILYAFVAEGLFASCAVATDDDSYLAQLLARAQREHLAERPEWLGLLHYKPLRFARGSESLVDADTFFLSPDGKCNPQAELDATLAGFFATNAGDPEKSPQCRFPARYHWLNEELAFDSDRLPQLPCRQFHRWFEEMNPSRLTLIFPAAYLNNPASMFGHTLLRVDAQGQDEQTRLLAYTINYAADAGGQRGAPFAFKGLFGGYHGRFSFAPFYSMVKTYGDIENRDIWEYGLNLTTEEISQMMRHVWEMRSAWFDYYFLDENCSYHLLSLLETARADLQLTGRFSWWAIPSETMRAVVEAGLVTEVRFRPARNTVLQERVKRMDSRLQILAKPLTVGELTPDSALLRGLEPEEQARVIELALDYAAFLRSPGFGRAGQDVGMVGELLMARSRLDVPDQTPEVAAPGIRPDEGHKPARAGVGYGFENRRQFVEFTASPGYHDILDPEGGFTRGARISILNTALRYYPEDGSMEIDRVALLDIMSLSSWNRFLHPVSWKAALGVERKHWAVPDRLLMGRFNGGIGISHDFTRQTSAHVFAEGAVELSDRFAYFAAAGVGPRFGVVHDFSERWRTGMSFLWQLFFVNEWRNDSEAVIENRFTINRQNVVRFDLEWKREFGISFPGGKIYWQFYW